jgi:hypothetical protein
MWFTSDTNLDITEYSQIEKTDDDCSSLFSMTNQLTQAPFGYGQDFFLVYKTQVTTGDICFGAMLLGHTNDYCGTPATDN